MIINNLTLRNIGPFREIDIEFPSERREDGSLPVTIITGENGAGKSIILDAIRSILKGGKGIGRNIISNEDNFLISGKFADNKRTYEITTNARAETYLGDGLNTNAFEINKLFWPSIEEKDISIDWVIMYWSSVLPTGSFEIKNIVSPEPHKYLSEALNDVQKGVEVTELICYFDYLKSSEDIQESQLGQVLYDSLKLIISRSLSNGELKNVSRKKLEPIIIQNGKELTLSKLSSGNILLIQRMVSLLGKMYSVSVLKQKPLSEIFQTEGILLIDEAENHLHPKWQKTFINTVQELFPRLQVILTTHSPFIVASVKDARIFVCESTTEGSIVKDESDEYSNIPVDEILLTPVFKTQPYGPEISKLILERKEAIKSKDIRRQLEVETALISLNPLEFSFINIDKKIDNY